MSLLFKKYYSYCMPADSTNSRESSTDTSTDSSTDSSSTTTTSTTALSNASLAVKDKSGNVGVINGLTSSDISKLSSNIATVNSHTNSINNLTSALNNEINARTSADSSLEYNISNNYVTLATDQTLSSSKTFKMGNGHVISYINTAGENANPSSSEWSWQTLLRATDKNGYERGAVQSRQDTNGRIDLCLSAIHQVNNVQNYASMSVCVDKDGTQHAYAPEPPSDSQDTHIATTSWVKNKINNVVTTTDQQEITGHKKFKGNLQIKNDFDINSAGGNTAELTFADKNNEMLGYVAVGNTSANDSRFVFSVNRPINGSRQWFQFLETLVSPNGFWRVRAQELQPVGSVIAFAAGWVPQGFLYCDGSAISRTTYADLFSTIGTIWGSGDGYSTFNLPDFRWRFLECGQVGNYYSAGLPNITGTLGNGINSNGVPATSGALYVTTSSHGAESNGGYTYFGFGFNAWNSNNIYGSSSTVQPPAAGVNFCIKY